MVKAIKRPNTKLKDEERAPYLATPREPSKHGVTITTVHDAKGETHDVTVLYVPKCTEKECPSTTWWSSEADVREERRVAFVAASRPRHMFVLCAHHATVARLKEKQPEFISLFQEVNLDLNLHRTLVEIFASAKEKISNPETVSSLT